MKDDDIHLLDVERAAALIVQFSEETDRSGFRNNPLYQSAILHQFLVLGEAVKRLSNQFRAQHPGIPWSEMAGMRDRLIHGYDSVNVDTVWDAATRDVPALLSDLQSILPQRDQN